MTIEIFDHEPVHQLGGNATHPIERILTRLGALLHPWRTRVRCVVVPTQSRQAAPTRVRSTAQSRLKSTPAS
jgi:hypothetical protein